MLLTPLGTGACYCSAGYGYTCNLVDRRFLIDVAPHAEIALRRVRQSVDDLVAVLITHFDPDHVLGFPMLIPARSRDTAPLPVYAPEGAKDYLTQLSAMSGRANKLERVEFIELPIKERAEFNIGDYDFSTYPMDHQDESLAFLMKDSGGRSLAISGDTTWNDNLADLISVADDVLIEMTFIRSGEGKHLFLLHDLQKILKAARGESRIILTHLGSKRENYEKVLRDMRTELEEPLASRMSNIIFAEELVEMDLS
jgi:ribonuclease BN (tRNA processing enzyme)